jgi:peptide/nickel transport system substrate-binding protein
VERVANARSLRQRPSWLRTVIVLFVGMSLLAAACGDDDDGASTGGSTEPVEEAGEPQVGGAATLLVQTDQASMDPARLTGSGRSDAQRAFAVYGALIAMQAETGEVEPVLAESLTPDDTFGTWTLVLRDGLKFTDGAPFDAEAVKVNWDRIADPATRSPASGLASSIERTEVVDARTLEITLKTPNAQFDNGVARQALNYIASPVAIRSGHDLATQPIGAGPFKMDSWIRDDRMELSRNDGWYDAPRPYLDRLTIRVVTDEEQRTDTFLTGGADVIFATYANSMTRLDAENDGPSVRTRLALGQVLAFNVNKAPFDDERVRRAMVLGVDRQAMAEVSEGEGVDFATHFSIAGSWWADDDALVPEYDPDESQRLFSEYAAETGEPVRIVVSVTQTSANQTVGKFLIAALSQMDDVEIEMRTGDGSSFIQWALQKDFDATLWGFPTIDPDPGLYNAVHSDLATNVAGYSNPEVDQALDAARMTADNSERAGLYQEIQRQLVEDLPFVPLTNTTNMMKASSDLAGVAVYEDGILRSDLLWRKG